MFKFFQKTQKEVSQYELAVMTIEMLLGRQLTKEQEAEFLDDYFAAAAKEILAEKFKNKKEK
jgi:hypothetical protein